MNNDGLKPKVVKVDGGMVSNNWFSQFLSDILDIKVIRPKINETLLLELHLLQDFILVNLILLNLSQKNGK